MVLVTTGRDRGKTGRVQKTLPKEGRVLVEGVNIVSRHMKPRGVARQAGIIRKEMPVRASNVAVICSLCTRATRLGATTLADGTKARVCRRCGEAIE